MTKQALAEWRATEVFAGVELQTWSRETSASASVAGSFSTGGAVEVVDMLM